MHALIAGTATARLVADLLHEGAELDHRVLDVCVAALERCRDLARAEVGEACDAAIRCLTALGRSAAG